MTHPLLLDSLFINRVVLTHPTPQVSDTLVSIKIVHDQSVPSEDGCLIISGKWVMAVGEVFWSSVSLIGAQSPSCR